MPNTDPWLGLAGRVKRAFGYPGWGIEPFGPDGRQLVNYLQELSIIATRAEHEGNEWVHASVAHPERMPTWEELRALKDAVYGEARFAYMVFPPAETYVNIHAHALHLWGRWDGTDGQVLPDFVGDWLAKTGELSL